MIFYARNFELKFWVKN